jgi:hypothetical protein
MKQRVSIAAAASGLAALALAAGPVEAHNAAHIILRDGTCLEVGSFKEAPIVGAGNPNHSPGSNNQPGQLDLIPGNGDQYGARYAADQGNSRLLPGPCPSS